MVLSLRAEALTEKVHPISRLIFIFYLSHIHPSS